MLCQCSSWNRAVWSSPASSSLGSWFVPEGSWPSSQKCKLLGGRDSSEVKSKTTQLPEMPGTDLVFRDLLGTVLSLKTSHEDQPELVQYLLIYPCFLLESENL